MTLPPSDPPDEAEVYALPQKPAELRPRDGAPFELIVNHDYQGCEHKRRTIDPKARTLTCKICGVALDPIEVISEIARGWTNFALSHQRLRQDIAAMEKRAEYLKRLESNTRSRLKRLGVEAPPKWELDSILSGRLRLWFERGKILLNFPAGYAELTPEEADEASVKFRTVATQARNARKRL